MKRRLSVDENTSVSKIFFAPKAGSNPATQYSLSGEDAAFFSISSTGVVTLKVAADYETRKSYDFSVIETLNGVSTTNTIRLAVKNLDDTAPVFTSSASGTVTENADRGTVVYHADAYDPDHPTRHVKFSLSGADAALLTISLNGDVKLRASPDAETKSSYSFNVVADDGDQTTTKAVVVTVQNVNDATPVFTSGATGSVAENAPIATAIYTAQTTDADGPAAPTYSLSGADAALLNISADGVVTLKASADYEAKTSYAFNVTANDGVHVATKAVVVSVTNETPHVSGIAITSATGATGTLLNAGDVVSMTVTMTESTNVTGTPQLALNIGGTTVHADYASGSGSKSLVFTYTIAAGQTDLNGISVDANSLSLNGGTLSEPAATAVITHSAVSDNASFRVDTTAPTLAITSSADILQAGQTATITFTFSEDPGASFTQGDIAVDGGTLGAFSGSGLTRTATFTAASSANLSTGAHISVLPGNFSDAAGNAGSGSVAPSVSIDTVFNQVLLVGNSATFGRVDPVLSYNTYDATTNPGGVHDLTSPDQGGTFTNLTGSNLYEPHNWGGVAGLLDAFASEVGLSYDVSLSTRNAATLRGHYANTSPAGWDLRGNIASKEWDIVVLQDQTDEPLPGGSGSITFAPGSSTATLIVTSTGDVLNEYDETFALKLAAGTGYRVGTSSAITSSILNDDNGAPVTNPALPTVTLTTNGGVLEDGHANLVFTFTRAGSTLNDLTISFTPTRDGSQPSVASPLASTGDVELYSSATNLPVAIGTSGSSARFSSGGGFVLDSNTGANTTTGAISFTGGGTGTITIKAGQTSASVTYDPRADTTLGESDESIRFTLNANANYNVGTLGAVTGTIINDDFPAGTDLTLPNITLGLSSATAVYENSGQNLVYTFTRSGETTNALTVNFTEDGTATYFQSDASKSDFSLSSTGSTGFLLKTTSSANADTFAFEQYATLIENYIHTGAADSVTIPGQTIPANPNADASTDIYLYSTWARPDMVAGAYDMITTKVLQPNGAYTGGTITQSTTQATAYYLTLEEMSTDLANAYNHLAQVNTDFDGVAAVSTAFINAVTQGIAIRDPYTETDTSSVTTGKINLWFDDNLHASKYGSYLAGLTLFQTITGLDARALGANDKVASDLGIDTATAAALQNVASATAGFNAAYHYTSPGVVTDLGTMGAATLASAGAFTFVDATYTSHTVSVSAQDGNLGTLQAVVRSDGHAGQVNWIYTVDNEVVDPLLASGEQRMDWFNVLLDDGHGHVSTEVVGITLQGDITIG